MLAATTELRSCQAADCYQYNLGMLNRMICGSKRMLIARNAEGKVLARAVLRLMTESRGTPVLTVSMMYGDAHGTLQEHLLAYVCRRARAMGLSAASTSFEQSDRTMALTSLGHPIPDYWDEERGLSNATKCVSADPLTG